MTFSINVDTNKQIVFIIADFNNTLVDYINEYNYRSELYEDFEGYLRGIKNSITKCLNEFEKQTGLFPVVCIITNASMSLVDKNGFNGICGDLKMTFFNHEGQTRERKIDEISHSCERFFKYVIHRENEGFLEINPMGTTMNDMFKPVLFSDKAMSIHKKDVKRESVERMICDIGPIKSKFVIFAGDSIQDDYPMKYGVSDSRVNRIFIRPGKVTKMKESIMQQFCQAKGIEFDCVNPSNNKKVKIIDNNTVRFLSDEQREKLYNYDDGDTIILTNPNSKGFVEGIYQSIDIINDIMSKEKNKEN